MKRFLVRVCHDHFGAEFEDVQDYGSLAEATKAIREWKSKEWRLVIWDRLKQEIVYREK